MLQLCCFLQTIDNCKDPQHEVPINQGPVAIDSAFFQGVMEIHLKGLPNSQQQLFEGKKRFFQIMCQVSTVTVS
jgi:hypothetical protein